MKRELMAGLIAVLLIASAMMFSGCVEQEKKMSVADIKAEVLANAEETDTYNFDMAVTMKMLLSNETNETEMTTISNGRGVLDVADKKMKLNMNTSMETNETTEAPGPMEMEMYLINSTMYTKMNLGMPGLPPQWTKREMPVGYEESWASQNQLEQQMELLNISEVELLADEEVNGVDCYVLEIVPDMEKFWNSTMAVVMDRSTQGLAPGLGLRKILESMSTKEWIAKDTLYPMKTQMAVRLVVSSEDLAIPDMEEEFTMTADEEVEILFYDYNKPVSIELPEAAEAAVEPPLMPMLNQSAFNQTALNQTAITTE
jgi:outer membrane lipoprotein-sorting protein